MHDGQARVAMCHLAMARPNDSISIDAATAYSVAFHHHIDCIDLAAKENTNVPGDIKNVDNVYGYLPLGTDGKDLLFGYSCAFDGIRWFTR